MRINDLNPTAPIRGANRALSATPVRHAAKSVEAAPPARSAQAAISSPAQLLSRAGSDLQQEREIRSDAVEAARAALRNWQGLDPAQLSQIADGLLSELP